MNPEDQKIIAAIESRLNEPPDESEPCTYCKGRCRCAEYDRADARSKS